MDILAHGKGVTTVVEAEQNVEAVVEVAVMCVHRKEMCRHALLLQAGVVVGTMLEIVTVLEVTGALTMEQLGQKTPRAVPLMGPGREELNLRGEGRVNANIVIKGVLLTMAKTGHLGRVAMGSSTRGTEVGAIQDLVEGEEAVATMEVGRLSMVGVVEEAALRQVRRPVDLPMFRAAMGKS